MYAPATAGRAQEASTSVKANASGELVSVTLVVVMRLSAVRAFEEFAVRPLREL